jgi:hypothetical protein
MYGGNKNKVGWEMIGFPGAYADNYNLIHKRGVPSRGGIESLCHLKGLTNGCSLNGSSWRTAWFGSIPSIELFIIRLIVVFAFGFDRLS